MTEIRGTSWCTSDSKCKESLTTSVCFSLFPLSNIWNFPTQDFFSCNMHEGRYNLNIFY
jgi:hypothetical protein